MQPTKLMLKKQKELVQEIIENGNEGVDIRGYSIWSYQLHIMHIHRPAGVGTISSVFLGKTALAPVPVYPETLVFLAELLGEEIV